MTQQRIPLRPDPGALRNRSAATLVRSAASFLLAHTRGNSPLTEATNRWPEDRDLHTLVKSVVSPASTSASGWADTLALTALADFILSMGPSSAGAALLARGMSLQFSNHGAIAVPACIASSSNTSFVGQGRPIPVRELMFEGPTLAPSKFATLSVFSRETIAHSTPTIEALTHAVLGESVSLAMDLALFDDAPGDEVRPPGLRNGIAAQVASVLADPLEAMLADIKTLAVAVAPIAGNAPIVLVANPVQAVSLRSWPQRIGYEVLASNGVAEGSLIAIAPNAVTSALDPLPRFEIARQGTLHMETSPTAISAVGSPSTVAAPVRSLWQTDSVGLRLIMECSWGLRSSSGLAWLTGATW